MPLIDLSTLKLPPQHPERFKQAKAFTLARVAQSEYEEPLCLDFYVDAKDSINNWCVALIKKVNHDEKSVRLSFEGWSSKYDVEVKRVSTKIAPFRTHTQGYTGQSKTAYRDFKLQQPYMVFLEKKIQEILDSNFLCFQSAIEVTQFLRGELYYYVDSLLTLHQVINSEDLPLVFQFIELVIKLTLRWYEIFPVLVPAWQEAQSNPMLFNVDI